MIYISVSVNKRLPYEDEGFMVFDLNIDENHFQPLSPESWAVVIAKILGRVVPTSIKLTLG